MPSFRGGEAPPETERGEMKAGLSRQDRNDCKTKSHAHRDLKYPYKVQLIL